MILFYLLSFVILTSSILLITNRNPVNSVLNLVCLFVCGSIQLLILEADFLAYVFIIVYAGAVAILFLFIVIILDIKQYKTTNNLKITSIFLLLFSFIFYLSHFFTRDYLNSFYNNLSNENYSYYIYDTDIWKIVDSNLSINTIGQVLYSEYAIHFVLSGFVLLTAIIGAIVLTYRIDRTSHKQNTARQHERSASLGKYKSW